MRNPEYWRSRAIVTAKAAQRKADVCIHELERMYFEAERATIEALESWYARFAGNNGVSLAEARRLLTERQLEELKWDVEKYIRAGQQANVSPEWLKKLENASARFHVSRLEAVQLQIQQQAELLYGNQLDLVDRHLRDVAADGYLRAAYDIQRGVGVGWNITALDSRRLNTLLTRPWTADGKTFCDRCWEGKAGLTAGIQTALVQGMLRGDSLQKMTEAVKNRFGVSRYQAGRLVHTETTYFNAAAARETYKDLDLEEVEVLETLDKHTCDLCGSMDKKIIPMSQYEPGVTVPPFHPNCRGTTAPVLDEETFGPAMRAARGEDGEVYYVPSNMSYREWKKAYVDKRAGAVAYEATLQAAKKDTVKNTATEKPEDVIVTNTPKKPENPTYGCKDVTQEWFAKATPNSHKIMDVRVFEQDGVRYAVDGRNVKLDPSEHERKIAELLESTLGGDLRLMPKVSGRYKGVQTPDYLFRGERWELKTISKGGKDAVYNAIHKKREQATVFVIELQENAMTRQAAGEQIENLFSREYTSFVKRIVLVDDGEIVKIFERA